MSTNDDRKPQEIERDIARTRGDLAQTLDALERKLDTRRLAEKGMDMFNNHFMNSDAVNRGIDAIRANPVPVALIGIGAAWLAASSSGMAERLANDERVESVRRRVNDLASDVGHKATEVASSVAGTIGLGSDDSDTKPLGHTGNPIVDEPSDKDEGWIHHMSGVAQDTLRSARDAVMDGPVSYASDGASRIADRVSGAFDRHPLAIGAVGVMAGMLVAALLPMTKTETELLGDSSNQLWQKAREAGEDMVSRVKETATQAATQAATQVATQVAEQAMNVVSGDSESSTKNGSASHKPS